MSLKSYVIAGGSHAFIGIFGLFSLMPHGWQKRDHKSFSGSVHAEWQQFVDNLVH